MIQFVEQLVEWRDTTTPQELLHAPPSISQTIPSNFDTFLIYIDRRDKSYACTSTTTCQDLIERILTEDNKSTFDYYNASTRPMLKFAHRNEFLFSNEPYPLLQYAYIQECLCKKLPIKVQLLYIELPKRSKKLGVKTLLVEPNIFPSIIKSNLSTQQLLPLQSPSTSFKFTFRLRPCPNAKETIFQLHSGIYYARRCLYSFDQINWNNTFIEEITQTTTLPIANLLPGSLLCLALTSKHSEKYFLNISLFRSNGFLLNGSHEYTFNLANSTVDYANTKHVYPDAFVGSSNNESVANHYEIKLKFDYSSYRFYSNEEISEKLVSIHQPTPTAVSTAKHQQHQEISDDVANVEALNYLLGILNDEVIV